MNNDTDFIFNPKTKIKSDKINTDLSKEYYCLGQDSDFIDHDNNGRHINNNDLTLAIKINKDNNILYQIKTSYNSKLYNPLSKFDREKSYSFLDNVLKPTDKFISVNRLVFDYYLRFLQTGNEAWLNKAERERL